MRRLSGVMLLALGLAAGAAGGYWYARPPFAPPSLAPNAAASADRKIIYYRDPTGAPYWSAAPKKDAGGRDYLPVYEDEEPRFGPGGEIVKPAPAKSAARKILYYRNPMGLPDVSRVPKKDAMGMDYIAVYEGEEPADGKTFRVSSEKIQRSGVRTEAVEKRAIVHPVRAVGAVTHDETGLTIVTVRADGYIEDLFVNKTGQHVRAGEPLFRIYSPDIQRAQIDLMVAVHAQQRGVAASEADKNLEGAMQRLRNLGVPEARIREVREKGVNPRTLDWPSPADGDVIEKRIINGQRVTAGMDLYRISDHSRVWLIADVAEADLGEIGPGTHASVTFRAYPSEPVESEVAFVYPELKAETRTARVRIELANPGNRLKPDMYADVVFRAGSDAQPVVAVPASAVIDSGTQQIVLVAKGEGRFEPRRVKLGRRGDGYLEVLDGVATGEAVVTSATFLIDAESNLRAALQGFAQPEAPK
jgi:membrane fusion protein, copper/silver efflux system